MFRLLSVAALSAAAAGASAQPAGSATTPDIEYRSAFDSYKAWNAQSPRNWREVNEEVERLGGHMGHLRSTPLAVPAPTPPAPSPHSLGNPANTAPEKGR